jgi:uncharacterized phage protein (TIGR02220 family)
MARRISNTVDYFPHNAKAGKTIAILEGKYGLAGYAFWFKLLESLCTTDNHCLDLNDLEVWEYFLSVVKVDGDTADAILGLLANLGNIDSDLWTETRLVWCQALVDNIRDVYAHRGRELPTKPALPQQECEDGGISGNKSTQSKVKESRVDTLSGKPDAEPIIQYLNQKTGRKYHSTEAHSRPISARLREGYAYDDFVTVIDSKVRQWGADPKMAEYLRPETLFGTKFDSYLATAKSGGRVIDRAPAHRLTEAEEAEVLRLQEATVRRMQEEAKA